MELCFWSRWGLTGVTGTRKPDGHKVTISTSSGDTQVINPYPFSMKTFQLRNDVTISHTVRFGRCLLFCVVHWPILTFSKKRERACDLVTLWMWLADRNTVDAAFSLPPYTNWRGDVIHWWILALTLITVNYSLHLAFRWASKESKSPLFSVFSDVTLPSGVGEPVDFGLPEVFFSLLGRFWFFSSFSSLSFGFLFFLSFLCLSFFLFLDYSVLVVLKYHNTPM